MSKIVKSMRGEDIDFDKLQIKKIISDIPITDDIKKRERFVNARKRRGSRKRVAEMVNKKISDEVTNSELSEIPSTSNESENLDSVMESDDVTESTGTRRRKVK